MNYGEIKTADIANGKGVRVSLFVSGCTHHCKGCFNPETWDFSYGKPFTKDTEDTILKEIEPSYVAGLSLLGGEPFEPQNQKALLSLLRRFRQMFPKKNVWCYSGYRFEELAGFAPSRARTDDTDEMLSYIDILVDGEFEDGNKDISLKFRGSSNQRIIDVQKSLTAGRAVLADI